MISVGMLEIRLRAALEMTLAIKLQLSTFRGVRVSCPELQQWRLPRVYYPWRADMLSVGFGLRRIGRRKLEKKRRYEEAE